MMKKETWEDETGSGRAWLIILAFLLPGIMVGGIQYLSSGPDLTLSTPMILDVSGVWQYEMEAGDSMAAKFYIQNLGGDEMPEAGCEYVVHLVPMDGGGPERNMGTYGCRHLGQNRNVQNIWKGDIPDDINPGEYYLSIRLDPGDRLNEHKEHNNLARVSMLVVDRSLAQDGVAGL